MKKYTSENIKEFISKPLFDEKVILNKDTSWPKISIVTPSYNQAKFLERTILSVLNQNYPNLEYIIIDGGSRDGSVEIIRKYEKYLTYWVSGKDNGQADAINKGLRKAKGEIVAYLNSDDTYCPGTLMEVAHYFRKCPDRKMIYGDYNIIDSQDNIIKYKKEIIFDYNVLLYGFSYIPQPTVFLKREVFEKIGLFNIELKCTMDLDYWVRVSKEYKIYHIPTYFANFRIHSSSKTWTQRHVFKEEELLLREKYTLKYPRSIKIRRLYFYFLYIIYRIKRIYLKLAQGCYW